MAIPHTCSAAVDPHPGFSSPARSAGSASGSLGAWSEPAGLDGQVSFPSENLERPCVPWQCPPVRIDSDFHGGSIEVLDASDPANIRLALQADEGTSFRQWFCFRVTGGEGVPCRFVIENAGDAAFPDAFESYRACSSSEPDDEHSWVRVPTSLEEGALVIEDTPDEDEVLYAYFAPYSERRHALLIEAAAAGAEVEILGQSVEGRDITLLVFGEETEGRARVWITARQHPGETMAEWFAEGLVQRLLEDDEDDAILQDLRDRATIYVVPCMCPDGAARGQHRFNAKGMNLNRAWQSPTEEESPEVLCVRKRMEQTGVDVFLDIHGDERLPFCFAVGCEGNPSYDDRIDALEDLFMESLIGFDEDFQRQEGYENDAPGEGDLTSASNWVGETFGCLSLTIEMPFTENANLPDDRRGWSPTESKDLGAQSLSSIAVCLDDILRHRAD